MQSIRIQPPCPKSTVPNWHKALAEAVRDPDELCAILKLPDSFRAAARSAVRQFPLLVPRDYLRRIEPGNVNDPLLRQVLPIAAEDAANPQGDADPVGDVNAERAPGLLHKYHGRALLITSHFCAINCRYCFRRHFPYDEAPHSLDAWTPALQQIASDTTLHEIILSGGDPLTKTDDWLGRLVDRLDTISHLRRLRLHTRLPIVIPQRVTDGLLALLRNARLTSVLVVHANHPRELEGDCARALQRLVDNGVPVLNQSVLLRGVNDDVETLAELCERLVDLRVIPYYLHQMDRVRGAVHFEVAPDVGRSLVEQLQTRLPGYAVPRYVREIPGEPSKTLL